MKRAPFIIVILGGFVCGGGAGWTAHAVFKRDALQPRAPVVKRTSEEKVPRFGAPIATETEGTSKAFFDRLHEVLGVSNRAKRERIIAGLADDLDATQIREAITRVSQIRIANRKEVLAQLFARWGELDPHAAIAFAESLPKASDRHDATEAILNGWVDTDRQAAENWARALPNGRLKSMAWQAIVVAQAAEDPMRALTLAQEVELSWADLGNIGDVIFGAWAVRDSAGAATQADRLPQGPLKMDAQCIIAKQWAEIDPASAIAWAQSLPDLLPNESDGFGGRTTSMGAERSNTAKRIIETWLKRDSGGAIRWLSELPDDPWKTLMITDACSQNTETTHDPDVALRLANLFPQGGRREEALQYTAERLGQIHPESALALLSPEMDEKAKGPIMSGLAESLKGETLLAALRQAQTGGFPLEGITRWADPATAADWAAQQPYHEKYLPQVAGAWMAKDPDRGAEFVRNLPAPMKDAALSRAVENSLYGRMNSAPEMADQYDRIAGWAAEIADPALRQTTYRNLAQAWIRFEPESGRRWIESAPLSPGTKSELLKARDAKR
jgi:hypothetical protein